MAFVNVADLVDKRDTEYLCSIKPKSEDHPRDRVFVA